MISKTSLVALMATLALGSLVGCAKNEVPALAAPALSANADLIQDCQTLTAPKNREYRIASERECLAQPSLDARMKSKACLVQQEIGRCLASKEAQANGYDAAQAMAETAEARRY